MTTRGQQAGAAGLAALVPTSLVALHAWRYGEWIVDDAGITFAYARSMATGLGPVLQPGADPVEGFSNPTWTAALMVGKWLHLFDTGSWFGTPDIVAFPKALAVLCCFAMFACMYAIAAAVARRPAVVTLVAGAITAGVPAFVIWSMSGLENSLFALSVVALATVLVRAAVSARLLTPRVAIACGALVAVAALTRPDGLVYVIAYPAVVALVVRSGSGRERWRAALPYAVAVAAPLGLYLIWRLAVFGRWLPNTALAKQQGLPDLADLNKPGDVVSYLGWLAVLLTAALVVAAMHRPGRTRTALVALMVPLGLALLSFAVLASDWMAQFRFGTPIWPLTSLVFVLAFQEVAPQARPRVAVALVAVTALVGVLTFDSWRQQSDSFQDRPTAAVCHIARNTGLTFNSYADRLGIVEASLLAVDAGGTSLTSRLRFVDLAGLADAPIADYWHRDDMAGLRDHVFETVRPTFIRVWWGWDGVSQTRILEDPRLARDYVLVWGPREGGGNYVRRNAVADPTALEALVEAAPELADWVDAPFGPDGGDYGKGTVSWWCDRTLRPSPPGSDPLTTMRR